MTLFLDRDDYCDVPGCNSRRIRHSGGHGDSIYCKKHYDERIRKNKKIMEKSRMKEFRKMFAKPSGASSSPPLVEPSSGLSVIPEDKK